MHACMQCMHACSVCIRICMYMCLCICMYRWMIDREIQYVTAEWKPAFLRQAREFLFFPLLPREASK